METAFCVSPPMCPSYVLNKTNNRNGSGEPAADGLSRWGFNVRAKTGPVYGQIDAKPAARGGDRAAGRLTAFT